MVTVTKTYMMNLLTTVPANRNLSLGEWQDQVIGRALVAIFLRQTRDERSNNSTSHNNNIGFAGCDAKTGSITAKYFIKHKKLLQFQRDCWMTVGRTGYPRLVKYDRQLAEIANEQRVAAAA
jgi:hypothetical protein